MAYHTPGYSSSEIDRKMLGFLLYSLFPSYTVLDLRGFGDTRFSKFDRLNVISVKFASSSVFRWSPRYTVPLIRGFGDTRFSIFDNSLSKLY